jgi:hypothetical protein
MTNTPNIVIQEISENTVVVQESSENSVVIISNQGPQGIPGTPGGPTGPTGIQGPTGLQGPTGSKGTYTVSETAPSNSVIGDAWFKSSTAQMYIRYDGFWVETSTSYLGPTGMQGPTGPLGGNGSIGGGSASSIYTPNQIINGGTAGSF